LQIPEPCEDPAGEFETTLQELLQEVFDAEAPFTQTTELKNCENCPFAGICGR
jgi:hypothetical protein